jgi:hypothetical protein
MPTDSDRHLAHFERVSPLILSMGMGIAADLGLGIVLVFSKSSSSKATDEDEQVESTGHMTYGNSRRRS